MDTLTNLPNHRYFDDHIKRVASKAQRDNANIGILYIDFDKFKPINDQYGHAAGDLVLHEISTRLSKLLRAEDLLARVGGDEFILTIHPLRNHEDLDDIAKRILIACHEPIITKDNTLQISASIGIATNQSQHFDEQELIQAADKAMYAAKKQGGNCFIYAVNP